MGAGKDMGSVFGASIITAVCVLLGGGGGGGQSTSGLHQRPEHSHHTYEPKYNILYTRTGQPTKTIYIMYCIICTHTHTHG